MYGAATGKYIYSFCRSKIFLLYYDKGLIELVLMTIQATFVSFCRFRHPTLIYFACFHIMLVYILYIYTV